jgi:uncharacterized protein YyaL (SSP411 family)
MVELTLRKMRQGGIYDHIGFGFHRYSTDPQWLLPHFERMLYDQALMAMAYIETYQATKKEEYQETANEVFTYVLRDMTDPSGAFYSAEDADSEGEEGKFYLWTEDEIRRSLSTEDADLFCRVYNIENNGNFVEQSTGRSTGANIPFLARPLRELAPELDMSESELRRRLDAIRFRLFEIRGHRPHPHKDDKILTDWNGLMIAALASGSQAFDEPKYADAARRAVDFIMVNMRTPEGRLLHRYRDGQAAVPGNIDDYSFLIWGLLNLYEATFDNSYLRDAIELNAVAIEHFWDEKDGAFNFTPDDAEELLVRTKEVFDGAVPSGNSVAALNLLRFGRITGNAEYEAKADKIFNAFSGQVRRSPQVFTMLLTAFDFAIGPSFEIVIVGKLEAEDTRSMMTALRGQFVPNKVVIFSPDEHRLPDIVRFAEFVNNQKTIDGRATAYVCRQYACDLPTTDIGKMLELLDAVNAER